MNRKILALVFIVIEFGFALLFDYAGRRTAQIIQPSGELGIVVTIVNAAFWFCIIALSLQQMRLHFKFNEAERRFIEKRDRMESEMEGHRRTII